MSLIIAPEKSLTLATFSAKITFHPPRLKSNHTQRILPPSAIPLNYRYPYSPLMIPLK